MRSDTTERSYGNSNYIVVKHTEDQIDELCIEVHRLIDEGFEPCGGIALRHGSSYGASLLQAMIYTGD